MACPAISTFISLLPSLLLLSDTSLASPRARLCSAVFVCVRYRCVWRGPWLSQTWRSRHRSSYSRPPGPVSPFLCAPSSSPAFMRRSSGIPLPPVYTVRSEPHILCLYFDCAVWLAGGCLQSGLFPKLGPSGPGGRCGDIPSQKLNSWTQSDAEILIVSFPHSFHAGSFQTVYLSSTVGTFRFGRADDICQHNNWTSDLEQLTHLLHVSCWSLCSSWMPLQ